MCVKAYPQPGSGHFFIDENYGAHNGLTGWVLNFFLYTSTGANFSDLKEMRLVHDSKDSKCQYVEYSKWFDGKMIPNKFSEVEFNYSELSDP